MSNDFHGNEPDRKILNRESEGENGHPTHSARLKTVPADSFNALNESRPRPSIGRHLWAGLVLGEWLVNSYLFCLGCFASHQTRDALMREVNWGFGAIAIGLAWSIYKLRTTPLELSDTWTFLVLPLLCIAGLFWWCASALVITWPGYC